MLRPVFNFLSSLLFVAVVIQVGLAGYGVFNALHEAKSGKVTEEMIKNGFDRHGVVGMVVLGVMVLLVLVAAAGKLGQSWLKGSVGLLVLGVIQMILGGASSSVPCRMRTGIESASPSRNSKCFSPSANNLVLIS